MKGFITTAITIFLVKTSHSRRNHKGIKGTEKTPLSVSLWRPFDCHKNADCSNKTYCRGWACVPRHKGFCTLDSECPRMHRCSLGNKCVKRFWCMDDSTCDIGKCCARMDPNDALGLCRPFTKPGQACLVTTKAVLCPCEKGYYCKPTSKVLGNCARVEKTHKIKRRFSPW